MTSAVPGRSRGEPNLIEGEFVFTASDYNRIASMLYDAAGIALGDTKAALVYSRLAKRVRSLGLANFAQYCDLLSSPKGADERAALVNALTTNFTRFFREPHHFDHLRDKVLAPRLAELRAGGRLRLWSAACSTGQEAYSMALTVLSVLPEAPGLDIKILATDIDSLVVARAKEGLYPAEALEGIPADLRDRWMRRERGADDSWRMNEAVRGLIKFDELNLIKDWPAIGSFDAIFCRNVVIYFDEVTQERVWSRFVPLIEPGGRLYIGHSERVTGSAAASFVSDGLTAYRLVGTAR